MPLNFQPQRLKAILSLGLPIIGGMLSQSLLNLVDAAMVGSLGGAALAGVGVGSYANFMVIALVLGLSAGVQTLVARRRGEGRLGEAALPLNGGLVLAVLGCIPLILLASHFSHQIVGLISEDSAIIPIADGYFDYRVLAALAVGLNVCFRGYWNGINHSLVYLRVLIAMHLLNVAFSYLLIFGALGFEGLGAPGAGLGTTLALYTGSVVYAWISFRHAHAAGHTLRLPDMATLRTILSLSVPSSAQQFLFATSTTVLFWIIARIGSDEVAIAHVLIHLALLLILPAVGLGMAATTLVSHAMGRKQQQHADGWGWDAVKLASLILFLLGLPLWFFPEQILSLFIAEPALVERAVLPLKITCLAIFVDATAIVLAQALLGAGANRTVMTVTTLGQWCFYLPLAWLVGPYMGGGLLAIWLVQLLHRGLSSVVFAYIWSRGSWTQIKL